MSITAAQMRLHGELAALGHALPLDPKHPEDFLLASGWTHSEEREWDRFGDRDNSVEMAVEIQLLNGAVELLESLGWKIVYGSRRCRCGKRCLVRSDETTTCGTSLWWTFVTGVSPTLGSVAKSKMRSWRKAVHEEWERREVRHKEAQHKEAGI